MWGQTGRCSREGKHCSNLECGGNGAVLGAWPGKVALESKDRRPTMPTHTCTRSLELHRGKASTPALGGSHTHSQSTPPARLLPPPPPQLVSPKRIREFLLLHLPSLAPLCLSAAPPPPLHTRQPAAPSPGPHYSEVTQRGSCEVLAVTLRHRQASRLPRAECGHPQMPLAPRVKPRTA